VLQDQDASLARARRRAVREPRCIHDVLHLNVVERVKDPERFMREGRCFECNPHVCRDTPWCHLNIEGHEHEPGDLERAEASDRFLAHINSCPECCADCPTCKRPFDEPQCDEARALKAKHVELSGGW
jgi:hypothetical protein